MGSILEQSVKVGPHVGILSYHLEDIIPEGLGDIVSYETYEQSLVLSGAVDGSV